MSRILTNFFDKHPRPEAEDVKIIYVFLYESGTPQGQNTMKNTARRVGAPRGAGGRAARPPQVAQGLKPRARHTAGRGAPRRIKKCVRMTIARGGGAGGKPWRPADKGKPLQPRTATHRDSRKQPGEADLCARRSRSPDSGRAPRRAGRTRRRSPTRATRDTREKHDMTMQTVRMCLEDGGGKGQPDAEI